MIMCVLLCYPVSIHMSQLLSTGRPISSFLVIPKFQPSVHKSVKQFGYSFAFDALTVWNVLPDEIRVSPSLASFRKHLKTPDILRGAWPLFCPWILKLVDCFFVLLRLKVLLNRGD